MAKLIIDDFVMLGRTFPQQTNNNGITVCACGYSHELRQLIRIYPLKVTDKIPKWSICQLELEKPKSDSRFESWKVISYKIIGKKQKDNEFFTLSKLKKMSIRLLNEQRLSLGVIEPKEIHSFLKPCSKDDENDMDYIKQLNLFLKNEKALYTPPFIPCLQIRNEDNSMNCLQLRDWGIAEFMRKGNDPNQIFSALKLLDSQYKQLLIVGNMKQFRGNWLIIATVMLKIEQTQSNLIATNQLSLFA